MEATTRLYCCPPLTAAMSADANSADGSAALVVRMGRDGALYFKITSGVHEPFDLNVNEPLAFCPFCGRRRDDAVSAAPAPAVSADTVRIEPPRDEEEFTVFAGRSPLILVGA